MSARDWVSGFVVQHRVDQPVPRDNPQDSKRQRLDRGAPRFRCVIEAVPDIIRERETISDAKWNAPPRRDRAHRLP
jgi:hypothetical protein